METSMKFSLHGLREGAAILLLAAAGLAVAQEFPTKPIRVIIPTAPGGQPDAVSRILTEPMTKILGQPFVVDNIAGSGGVAAIATAQAAPADGHTIFVADAAHWAISQALRPKQATDFLKIFTPIRQTHQTSIVLVVNNSLNVNNLQELVALIKANQGKFNYGSAGIGSVHHLTMEAFKNAFGLEIVHVPYKSSSLALPAIVSGELQMMFAGLASITPFVKTNRVKVIALANKKRTPLAGNITPVAESGAPDFDFGSAAAMFVRVGTPPAVIAKLAAAFDKAYAIPEVTARMTANNIEFVAQSSPESTLEMVRADIPRWAAAAKFAGAAE